MLFNRILVCFVVLFTQCIPEIHTAHILETMVLRLKHKEGNQKVSAIVREHVDEEPRMDIDLSAYNYDVTSLPTKRESTRSKRRTPVEVGGSTINRKRHTRRKSKQRRSKTGRRNAEQIIATPESQATTFNTSSNFNSTIKKDFNREPLSQARTEWTLTACEERRSPGLIDDKSYPLCTICTAKTTFPEGTYPREIHETICLPSGDEVVRDDTTDTCLVGQGQCKQRSRRIELRRLKVGSPTTHVYESQIEQDEWEYDWYEWRYSCDCDVTPGTMMHHFVR